MPTRPPRSSVNIVLASSSPIESRSPQSAGSSYRRSRSAGTSLAQTIDTERRHPGRSGPRLPAATRGALRPPAHEVPLQDRRRPVVGPEEPQHRRLEPPVAERGRDADPTVVGAPGVDELDGARHSRATERATRREVPAPEARRAHPVRDRVDERAGQPRRRDAPPLAAFFGGSRWALSQEPRATARTMTARTIATSERDRWTGGVASAGGWGGGLDGRGGVADGATIPVLAASRLRSSGWPLTAPPAPSDGRSARP